MSRKSRRKEERKLLIEALQATEFPVRRVVLVKLPN
jgi:hypothetical protein